jgi:hypothetical protein
MRVETNREEARARLVEAFPPGWRASAADVVDHHLALVADDRDAYAVDLDGAPQIANVALDIGLDTLDSTMRVRIAYEARDRIFVHAGVVAYAGGALLIPGRSFSGKTTLVAALVEAGATYYSDEYAALDGDGNVHPYARPLSLRDANGQQRNHPVQAFGGSAGEGPLPVRCVLLTTYRAGAQWAPQTLSAREGVLALIGHAVPVRDRPDETLRAAGRAAEGAAVLRGDRGDADALAPFLLAALEARAG